MKNAKKWALTAVILILTGLLLAGAAFVKADFRLENLSNQTIIENVYEFEDDYDEILISILNADVVFAHAEDNRTRVEIREIEKIPHSVQVSENALRITARDTRKWVDRLNFGISKTSVKVFLPESAYESAFILTLTGDISVPVGFSFGELDVCTSTGKLSVSDVKADNLKADGTTGRIVLSNVDIKNELAVYLTTGDISLGGVSAQKMTASATTGDVFMADVVISDLMSVELTTGSISFSRTDAGEAFLKTTTGDIEGTFLTDKVFDAKATTGSVRVPGGTSGGSCRARATTGHIEISIGG
ncbi:MAG: DUF4097 family beta strand repeat protein [Clostridia bacterium]|nr:DUF4097 family beta strand repeat protein [Clostridia bacterium]